MSQPAEPAGAASSETPKRSFNYEISPQGVSSSILTFKGKIQTNECLSLWESKEYEELKTRKLHEEVPLYCNLQ